MSSITSWQQETTLSLFAFSKCQINRVTGNYASLQMRADTNTLLYIKCKFSNINSSCCAYPACSLSQNSSAPWVREDLSWLQGSLQLVQEKYQFMFWSSTTCIMTGRLGQGSLRSYFHNSEAEMNDDTVFWYRNFALTGSTYFICYSSIKSPWWFMNCKHRVWWPHGVGSDPHTG